uniref:Myelin basic protein n=2 Tax=Lates calcarifer TaxID=8187 RepID=A0A4W6ECJ2_LATCA
MCCLQSSPGVNSVSVFLTVSVSSMGQHLGKRESPADSKASSPEPKAAQTAAAAAAAEAEPESQDEVFGLGEADANQNNGCTSEKPAVTDSTGAEGPHQPWTPASTADPDAATPRPHLVRLFSRDAPGREDNTFKDRPSESDELQTIQEHSGAASECGSESPEQDLE